MKNLMLTTLILMIGLATISAGEKDDEAIKQVVQSMVEGWNNKSGEQFASRFAPIHDYVIINGIFMREISPADNAASHQRIFDTFYADVNLHYNLEKIRYLTDSIAIVHVSGFLYKKGNKPENADSLKKAIITMVMQKKDGNWQIEAFQNTPVEENRD